jgi:hypothetical protein
VHHAYDTRAVDGVIAHTLADDNPSPGLLRTLGFERTAELPDPEVGLTWEWRLGRPVVDGPASS